MLFKEKSEKEKIEVTMHMETVKRQAELRMTIKPRRRSNQNQTEGK